jgi:hypothetical protein
MDELSPHSRGPLVHNIQTVLPALVQQGELEGWGVMTVFSG